MYWYLMEWRANGVLNRIHDRVRYAVPRARLSALAPVASFAQGMPANTMNSTGHGFTGVQEAS